MSFGIYIAGFLILICGLIYGAVILHVAPHWIAVGAIVLLGLAILTGVQKTRGKDPSLRIANEVTSVIVARQRDYFAGETVPVLSFGDLQDSL